MILSSLVLEILIVVAMTFIVARMWRTGRRENVSQERGWKWILGGFCLLFVGALVDLSDHFPEQLSRFVFLGHGPYQAIAEKFVGFLGGYVLLAVGFWRWLPHITERRRIETELRETTAQLELRVRRGSAELNLKRMDLEREIRQRQVATSELRRSRELLEKVVGNAPILLLACDTQGRISLVQGRAAEALGLPDKDSQDNNIFELYPSMAADLRLALDGRACTSTIALGEQTFELLHSPWVSEDDTLQGVVTVGTDVTDLHEAHQALQLAKDSAEEANQSKSQFLANMSHELRTPLNSVIGFANVLSKNKDARLNDKDLRYLDRIQDNGQHLLTLINEILDLSRIESGRVEVEATEVDLVGLIQETVTRLGTQKAEVPIVTHLPDVPACVDADVVKLRQVLINLLSNAVKFTDEGQVDVELVLEDDTARPRHVEVRDTGVGMSAEHLESIFEPFHQVDSSSSRSHGGSGLGLSISHSLCRLMDFGLEVESALGEGSTFRIVFHNAKVEDPVETGGIVSAPSRISDARGGKAVLSMELEGRNVLLIDDSLESRLLLLEMLQDLGCDVQLAASGEEGLILAQRQAPDLIILDLVMPDMDGWQVLGTLKRDPMLGSVPVLVASVVADDQESTLLGALEVLNKPIDRGQLEQVLARMLIQEPAKVLVVDDEEMIRQLLSELLGRRGYQVTTASNGEKALEVLEEQPHDLVLVDLIMPGMDGRELIAALRRDPRWRDLPVVVVTGMHLSDEERSALEERVEGILAKGFDLEDELRQMVSALAPS